MCLGLCFWFGPLVAAASQCSQRSAGYQPDPAHRIASGPPYKVRPPDACSCRRFHLPLNNHRKRESECPALADLRLDNRVRRDAARRTRRIAALRQRQWSVAVPRLAEKQRSRGSPANAMRPWSGIIEMHGGRIWRCLLWSAVASPTQGSGLRDNG
jgi:hypothetical protein